MKTLKHRCALRPDLEAVVAREMTFFNALSSDDEKLLEQERNAPTMIDLTADWVMESGGALNRSSAMQLARELMSCRDWGSMVDLMMRQDYRRSTAERVAGFVDDKRTALQRAHDRSLGIGR